MTQAFPWWISAAGVGCADAPNAPIDRVSARQGGANSPVISRGPGKLADGIAWAAGQHVQLASPVRSVRWSHGRR